MNKKINIPEIGIAEVYEFIPSEKEEKIINNFERQAEADIERKKNSISIHFRWSEFEIARAKKIAQKLGLPYQTYIKSLLKQGMDNDEKRLEQM